MKEFPDRLDKPNPYKFCNPRIKPLKLGITEFIRQESRNSIQQRLLTQNRRNPNIWNRRGKTPKRLKPTIRNQPNSILDSATEIQNETSKFSWENNSIPPPPNWENREFEREQRIVCRIAYVFVCVEEAGREEL